MMEFFDRLVAYKAAMSLAAAMLRQGIISERDYAEIDTIMTKKYGLSLDSIFRTIT
ncbi:MULTISPECIES: SHOCT domain-containing protein [unclassified Neglectibacter]|uniref:SHOCT domain-containing protein n=1 Tax=unclassified Neglectibacter TaxID=2632164 RepID=UPI001412E9F9|nr:MULTISPECIES: SHOCT domain-containing protein [unclassified Neglectibacter]